MKTTMKTTMKIILCLALINLASFATASPLSELKNCTSIKQDLKRLSCFDKKIKGVGEITKNNNSISVVDKVSPEPPVVLQQKTPTEIFGFEGKVAEDSPDEIHSMIVGEFRGWTGKTVFKLANGQVWKQSNSGKMSTRKTNPKVVIKKGFWGSFRLKIEGINKSITVRRIK